MKALKWTLVVAAIFVLPFILVKKSRNVGAGDEVNIRYDIDDYVAEQGL